MEDVIEYIKQFLVYGDEEAAKGIGYTTDESMWDQYKLVIVPGRNILTGEKKEWTVPDLQEKVQAEKTNAFVDEMGETMGGTWVIREDIIYNTFFCISLAGEFCIEYDAADRDQHGRIPSEKTPLGKQGLQTIPVLDEYSRLCAKLAEAPLPEQRFSKIVLTHDIDTIDHYRHMRGFLGGLKRGELKQTIQAMAGLEFDPAYTFPWLHNQDSRVQGAEELYFIKATNGRGYDYPQYNLKGTDFSVLLEQLHDAKATIGLHGSYYANDGLTYETEKKRLKSILNEDVTAHRNHYLRIARLEAMETLVKAGITDDYTMGWADRIGFRLGTTRPVRWINPKTLTLTSLTLHPLCIMDCTLSNEDYMNVQNEEEAYYLCQQLIDKVRQHGGELVLLWHNHIFAEPGYQKQLYKDIIDYLRQA